jgi:hypothetical protein
MPEPARSRLVEAIQKRIESDEKGKAKEKESPKGK